MKAIKLFKSFVTFVTLIAFLSGQFAWAGVGSDLRRGLSARHLAAPKQKVDKAELLLTIARLVREFVKGRMRRDVQSIEVEKLKLNLDAYLKGFVDAYIQKHGPLGFTIEADVTHLLETADGKSVVSVGIYDQEKNERLVLFVADKSKDIWSFIEGDKRFERLKEDAGEEDFGNIAIAAYRVRTEALPKDPQPGVSSSSGTTSLKHDIRRVATGSAFLSLILVGFARLNHPVPAHGAPLPEKPIVLAQAQEGEEPSAMDILKKGLKAAGEEQETPAPAQAEKPSADKVLSNWVPDNTDKSNPMEHEKAGNAHKFGTAPTSWRGGVVKPAVSLSPFSYVNITVRNTSRKSGHFILQLKGNRGNDDYLVREPVEMSEDGGWIEYQFEISSDVKNRDLTYLAVSDASVDFEMKPPKLTAKKNDQPKMPLGAAPAIKEAAPKVPEHAPEIAPAPVEAEAVVKKVLSSWFPSHGEDSGMTHEKDGDVHKFGKAPNGWRGGPVAPKVQLSRFKYVNVAVRNPSGAKGTFIFQLKGDRGNDDYLLREPVEMSEDGEWIVYQYEIPEEAKDRELTYTAVSDSTASFEMKAPVLTTKKNDKPKMPLKDLRGALPVNGLRDYLYAYPTTIQYGALAVLEEMLAKKDHPMNFVTLEKEVRKEIQAALADKEVKSHLNTLIEEESKAGRMPMVNGKVPTVKVLTAGISVDSLAPLLLLLSLMVIAPKTMPNSKRARACGLLMLYLALSGFADNAVAQEAAAKGAFGQISFSRKYELANKSDREAFIKEVIARESQYFKPGVGFDPLSGMAHDSVTIVPGKWVVGGINNWGAASKESVHIPELLGAILRVPGFENVGMSRAEALGHLKTKLASIKDFIGKNPGMHGLVPWIEIGKDGSVKPSGTMIPTLDPGEMIWSLPAIEMALKGSSEAEAKDVLDLAKWVKDHTDFGPFYKPQEGVLAATATLDGKAGKLSTEGQLSDMCEGTGAIVWAVLNGQVPQDAWDNIEINVVPYTTENGETIDVIEGYVASFHEYWMMSFLPFMDDPEFAALARNYLRVQAETARQEGMPGFSAAAYTHKGYETKIGPHKIAKHREGPQNIAVEYATALALLIDSQVGAEWMRNYLSYPGVLTPLGGQESVNPKGYSKVWTTDDKGNTMLSLSQGIHPWLIGLNKQYMAATKAKIFNPKNPQEPIESDKTMLEVFQDLLRSKIQKGLAAKRLTSVRTSTQPIPLPLSPEKQFKVVVEPPKQMTAPLIVTDHLQGGHFHKFRAFSYSGVAGMNWELHPDKDTAMAFAYDIPEGNPKDPKNAEKFPQWAAIGTFIEDAYRAGVAKYNRMYITIPADSEPHLFNVEFKSDNDFLAIVPVDTEQEGTLSEDGKFKTIGVDVLFPEKALTDPVTYLGISVNDPGLRTGKYQPYARKGKIRIKDIKLAVEKVSEKSNVPPVRGEKEFLRFMNFPHGDMRVEKLGTGHFRFHFSPNTWRGGFVPGDPDIGGNKYLDLMVYNPTGDAMQFAIELKGPGDKLLMEVTPGKDPPKYVAHVPAGKGWHTVSVPLVSDQIIKYFAVSDSDATFEMGWATLSVEPLSGGAVVAPPTPAVTPAPEEIPSPAPSQEAPAQAVESAPAAAAKPIDVKKLFEILMPDVEAYDKADNARDVDAARAVVKRIGETIDKYSLTPKAQELAQGFRKDLQAKLDKLIQKASAPAVAPPTVEAPTPSTTPVESVPPSGVGISIGQLALKDNLLEDWKQEHHGGDFDAAKINGGGYRITGGSGYVGGGLKKVQDFSKHKFVNVVVRNTSGAGEGGVFIDLKQGSKWLLGENDKDQSGGKKWLAVPGDSQWYVVQIEVPEARRKGILNYLGFSDVEGTVEVKGVYFSDEKLPKERMPLKDLRGALPIGVPGILVPKHNQWLYGTYLNHAMNGDVTKVREVVLRGKYVSPSKRAHFNQVVHDEAVRLLGLNLNLSLSDIVSLLASEDISPQEATTIVAGRVAFLATAMPPQGTDYVSFLNALVRKGVIRESDKDVIGLLRTVYLMEHVHRMMAQDRENMQEEIAKAEQELMADIAQEISSDQDAQAAASEMAAAPPAIPSAQGAIGSLSRGAAILAFALGLSLASPTLGNVQGPLAKGTPVAPTQVSDQVRSAAISEAQFPQVRSAMISEVKFQEVLKQVNDLSKSGAIVAFEQEQLRRLLILANSPVIREGLWKKVLGHTTDFDVAKDLPAVIDFIKRGLIGSLNVNYVVTKVGKDNKVEYTDAAGKTVRFDMQGRPIFDPKSPGETVVLPEDLMAKEVEIMVQLKPILEKMVSGFDINRPENRGLLEGLVNQVVMSNGQITLESLKQAIEKTPAEQLLSPQGLATVSVSATAPPIAPATVLPSASSTQPSAPTGSKLEGLLGTGGILSKAPPIVAPLSAARVVDEHLGVMGDYEIRFKSYQDETGAQKYGLFAHKSGEPFPDKPFQSYDGVKKRHQLVNVAEGPLLLLVVGQDMPQTNAGEEPLPASYSQMVFTVDEQGEIITAYAVTGNVGEHEGSVIDTATGTLQYHPDGNPGATRVALSKIIADARADIAAMRANKARVLGKPLPPVSVAAAPMAAPMATRSLPIANLLTEFEAVESEELGEKNATQLNWSAIQQGKRTFQVEGSITRAILAIPDQDLTGYDSIVIPNVINHLPQYEGRRELVGRIDGKWVVLSDGAFRIPKGKGPHTIVVPIPERYRNKVLTGIGFGDGSVAFSFAIELPQMPAAVPSRPVVQPPSAKVPVVGASPSPSSARHPSLPLFEGGRGPVTKLIMAVNKETLLRELLLTQRQFNILIGEKGKLSIAHTLLSKGQALYEGNDFGPLEERAEKIVQAMEESLSKAEGVAKPAEPVAPTPAPSAAASPAAIVGLKPSATVQDYKIYLKPAGENTVLYAAKADKPDQVEEIGQVIGQHIKKELVQVGLKGGKKISVYVVETTIPATKENPIPRHVVWIVGPDDKGNVRLLSNAKIGNIGGFEVRGNVLDAGEGADRYRIPLLNLFPWLGKEPVLIPGKDLTRPLAEGEVITNEETNAVLRGYLEHGVYTRKLGEKNHGYFGSALLQSGGSLGRSVGVLPPDKAALLEAKIAQVEELILKGVKTQLPEGVTYDQLVAALFKAELFLPDVVTIGDDVFAHTGHSRQQIYIGLGMLLNASAQDIAALLLEEAKHLVLDDPEHKKIAHDEALRQRLLTVALTKGKRAQDIAQEMDAFRTTSGTYQLTNAAKPRDIILAGRPMVIYLTVGPDFMVNLHNEIEARRGRNIKVVPVYKEDFMRGFDYLNTLAHEYPGVLMPPMDVAQLQARAPGKSLEDAAIAYAQEIVPGGKADARDIGWINSPDAAYRIPVVSGAPKILEVTPRAPAADEMQNIGSLLDVTELGILARRLAGDQYANLTFTQLADLLDPALKGDFLAALSNLRIADTQKVAEFVNAPMPVKSGSDTFLHNVDSLKKTITAA